MRKPFAVTMALLLAFGNLLPAAQPTLTNAAPPLPPTPTLTRPPKQLDAVDSAPHSPPSPDKLVPEIEQARARQAIQVALDKYLRYWGPRYQVAPVEVTTQGEWAHGVANWKSQPRTLKEPIYVLAHRLPNGTWQALMPDTDGLYLQWLDAMPESLVTANEKAQLRAQAMEANALRRPQAVPMVPSPVTVPGSEKPSVPVEQQGPVQPTATPTAAPSSVVEKPKDGWTHERTDGTSRTPMQPTPTVVTPNRRSSPVNLQQVEWAIYEDETFGYSFEYPTSWSVKQTNFSGSIKSVTIQTDNGQDSITLYVDADWQGKTKEPVNISLAGIPGSRRSIKEGQNPPQELVNFEKDGRVYTIQFIHNNDNQMAVFEHLLSSFYFSAAPSQKGEIITGSLVFPNIPSSVFPQCPAVNKSGWPTWGTVIVSAGNWNGVNVYSNGGDVNNACWATYGYNYQCVELAQRLYAQKWGYPNTWAGVSYAAQMMENHPSDIVPIWNGNSPAPQWGDALVFGGGGGGYGHVAVVTRVESGRVYFVEQNWSMGGQSSLAIDSNNNIENRGSYWIRGWLHSPRNGGGGSPLTASWSSPSNGQTINSSTVHLQANVSGGSGGVNRVSFSANWSGSWHGVATVSSSPYQYDWNWCNSGVPDGDVELGLEAWDNAGNHYVYSDHNANYHITKGYNCNPPPTADFDASPQSGNAPLTVQMHNISSGNYNSCSWDYGDGSTGTSCDGYHDHTYTHGGSFTVRLTVSGPGGSNTRTRDNYIVVSDSCSVPTPLSPNGNRISQGSNVTFSWSGNCSQYYAEYTGGPAGTIGSGWQSSTSWTPGQLWCGSYSWRVQGKTSAGTTTGFSSYLNFMVVPNTPTGLTASPASTSQINLSWNDPGGEKDGYKVYYSNGNYIGSTNSTSYPVAGLNCGTSYSFYVKAYRSSYESDASNTATASTNTCPPVDTQSPVVTWTLPVSNTQVYPVGSQTILLQAEATDNVGVYRVSFVRWDAVNSQWVTIGNDYAVPYQVYLDTTTLNIG